MTEPKTCQLSTAIYYGDESPIFGERSMIVRIEDESVGAFIVVENTCGGKIEFTDIAEMRAVFEAAKALLQQYPVED